MAFSVVAYLEARASAVTVLDYLTAVTDTHLTTVGDMVYVGILNKLLGAYAVHGTGAAAGSITQAQLESPSLRAMLLKDLAAGHDSLTALAEAMLAMQPDNPIELTTNEGLRALMTNGALAVAKGFIAVFLGDGVPVKPTGPVFTVRCTTTFTPTVDVWTPGALTFTQTLPVGTYQVVGMKIVSAGTAGIGRLIFVEGKYRPGVPITASLVIPDLRLFRHGNMGVFGEFYSMNPPTLEVCAIVAVATPTVYLDLIKVG